MTSVSEYLKPLKKLAPNPLLAALWTGGLVYGASKLSYPFISGAAKHTAAQLGMGDPESQHDIETNFNNSKYKTWVPIILGGLGAAGVLASSYNPSPALSYGGLFDSWDDPRRAVSKEGIAEARRRAARLKNSSKTEESDRLMKNASFSWDINDQTSLDFGKMLPVRMTKDIIMNDPDSEIYQKGNALDIINNASGYNDNGRMSAGSLFDSALNKVQQNLTLSGLAEAGTRAIIGYGVAKAFTNTMCNLIDMPKPLRDGIVSAGMITNVIQGLD